MEKRWDEKGGVAPRCEKDVSVLASGKGHVLAGLAMLAVHGCAWLRAAPLASCPSLRALTVA
jgi:hypothetical protein